jgi:hypothetical protein
MKGQWIGTIKVNAECKIILNVDDLGQKYGGCAFVTPDDTSMPATSSYFVTPDKKTENNFAAYIFPIDPRTGLADSWDNIKGQYPLIFLFLKKQIFLLILTRMNFI